MCEYCKEDSKSLLINSEIELGVIVGYSDDKEKIPALCILSKNDEAVIKINYCPMCGNKLEV